MILSTGIVWWTTVNVLSEVFWWFATTIVLLMVAYSVIALGFALGSIVVMTLVAIIRLVITPLRTTPRMGHDRRETGRVSPNNHQTEESVGKREWF